MADPSRISDWRLYLTAARRYRFFRPTVLAIPVLSIVGTAFEAFGLSLLIPIFQMTQREQLSGTAEAAGGGYLHYLSDVLALVALEPTLPLLLVIALVGIVIRQAVMTYRLIVTAAVHERLARSIRVDGFRAYLNASVEYHDNSTSGEIVNGLVYETGPAASGLVAPLKLLSTGAIALVYACFLLFLSWHLALISTAVLLIAALCIKKLSEKVVSLTDARIKKADQYAGFLLSRLNAIRLIRLSGTSQLEVEKMRSYSGDLAERNIGIWRSRSIAEGIIEPVAVGLALLFIFIGFTWFGLSIESIGLFLVILARLAPVAKAIVSERQGMIVAMTSLRAVFCRIEAMLGDVTQGNGTLPFSGLSKDIRLENLVYNYRSRPDRALTGVNLTIRAGSMVALVGPSGSGKSTLVEVLMGLRRPTLGRVLYDGIELGCYDPASVHRHIAYAPQVPFIVGATPREHIGYGLADPNMARIQAAADAAGAHDFIRQLPQSYDTPLAANGGGLSGGQRQRLDLARAIAHDAAILVLDEPTSNLDAETEEVFRKALCRLRDTRRVTIVMIGHRLKTAALADRIAVLQGGRVGEIGSHRELVSSGGWYARAWASGEDRVDVAPVEGVVRAAGRDPT